MINKYKKVSIIYGTRGKKSACAIHKLFSEKHSNEVYPVKSHLLANEYLNCDNIISTLKGIIASSDVCIVLLTFDDVNNTRVRQNILVEIGMTTVLLEPAKCYFFSEKIPLPEDFPSDLRNSINCNYFNPNEPDLSAEKIVETILSGLGVNSYKNILTDNYYLYDYLKIIRGLPASVYELEAETQMKTILSEWTMSLRSFDYTAERIVYILERCVFLPLFRYNESVSDFFTIIYEQIRPSRTETAFGMQQINALYLLADNILKYIELTIRQPFNITGQFSSQWYFSYALIADELVSLAEQMEQGTLSANWYLKMLAYDYSGLAKMKAVRYGRYELAKYKNELNKANAMFKKASVLSQEHCFHSRYLWEGYTQYNISRVYELLYERDKTDENMDGIRKASELAIKARRRIVDSSIHLKGIFSIALTYEYFQALYHEYDLEFKWPEFSEGDLNDMAERIKTALAELNIFCDSTGLKQLYDMRDSLQSLLLKTRELF